MDPREPLILLVEDDPDDADLAKFALERTGTPHCLRVVHNGADAVAYLHGDEVRRELPAVVLLDIKLPLLDGKVVLRELRGNPWTARVPVVTLTSSSLEQDVLDAYALGTNAFIQKPVDLGEFNHGVSVLMTYWLRINVPPTAEAARHQRRRLDAPGAFPALAERRLVPPAGACAPPPLGAAPHRRADVMVIDAHPVERSLTCEGLIEGARRQIAVEVCSFEEAAQYLWSSGGPPPLLRPDFPGVIVVDVDFPDDDGLDLLQSIRYRADHQVAIVVFSRDTRPELVSECYRLKVNGFVRKPEALADYRETVRLMSHFWLRLNEAPPTSDKARAAIAHPG